MVEKTSFKQDVNFFFNVMLFNRIKSFSRSFFEKKNLSHFRLISLMVQALMRDHVSSNARHRPRDLRSEKIARTFTVMSLTI